MKRAQEPKEAPTSLDLKRYVPALVSQLENKLTMTASAIYLANLGIGATEMRIVVLLGTQSHVSGNKIGLAIGLDKSAVSRALKSLRAHGLIDITKAHGRRRSVVLTRAGRDVHDRGVELSIRREERLLRRFTRAEREALISYLNRMLGNMPLVSALHSGGQRAS